jgi:hypothetical protein
MRQHWLILPAAPIAAWALAAPTAALAQVHEGDVVLQIQQGAIVTGAGVGTNFAERRVFTADLDFFGIPFTDNPGFDCLSGTFPVGSRNGFRIIDALRKWDGQDLDLIPPERMEISFAGGALLALSPPTPSIVEGFTLAVSSVGGWHRHVDYWLRGPDAQTEPTPGVYVLQLSLNSTSSSPTIGSSRPFWIVFAYSSAAGEHDAAAQWVLNNLVNPGGGCDAIDFNGDGLFPDSADLDDFVAVLAGGPAACSTGTCNDIDFNNDGLFPDSTDLDAFLSRLSGGACVR